MAVSLLWSNLEAYIERLRRRLRLEATARYSDVWQVVPVISPVTSVDTLLRTPKIYVSAPVAVTATGAVAPLQVGDTQNPLRWLLHALQWYVASGTFTVNTLRINDGAKTQTLETYASLTSGVKLFPGGLPLPNLMLLEVNVDTKAVNGTLIMTAYVEEEVSYD